MSLHCSLCHYIGSVDDFFPFSSSHGGPRGLLTVASWTMPTSGSAIGRSKSSNLNG
eukprot:COSAG01_NODE_52973_length_342_cov_1.213992_1_plen_55_part_10